MQLDNLSLVNILHQEYLISFGTIVYFKKNTQYYYWMPTSYQ